MHSTSDLHPRAYRSPQGYRNRYARIALIAGLVLSASVAQAQVTATGNGPDDKDTATLTNPITTIFASNMITTALTNSGFTVANGWNFTFAGAAASAFVVNDFTNPTYSAWVVNSLAITGQDGNVYNRNVTNQDAGGANYQLKYTPAAGDPNGNIHFLQAYTQSFNPVNSSHNGTFLDNPAAASPFYDPNGVSGIKTLAGNASWMLDIPYDIEDEFNPAVEPDAQDFFSNVQFNTFLTVDNVVAGVHNVTIYGGQAWGYTFSAVDAPEPTSLVLFGVGALPLLGILGVTRRRKGARKSMDMIFVS